MTARIDLLRDHAGKVLLLGPTAALPVAGLCALIAPERLLAGAGLLTFVIVGGLADAQQSPRKALSRCLIAMASWRFSARLPDELRFATTSRSLGTPPKSA